MDFGRFAETDQEFSASFDQEDGAAWRDPLSAEGGGAHATCTRRAIGSAESRGTQVMA
jgi:hypothetical protein